MDLSAFLSNIDKSAQGIAAALNHFGEHQLGPAVAAAGVVLAEFDKNQIEPIVAEVGQTLDNFGTNILGPAVVEIGRKLDEFRTNQLIPVVAKTGSSLDGYSKNKLGPAIADARTALDEFAQSKLGPCFEQLIETATKHPIRTGIIVASTLAALAPQVVSSLALGVGGFGSKGIAAGSLAATSQPVNIVAGSIYATLQSAAMGGYGAPIVNGIVAAVGAIVEAVAVAIIVNEGLESRAEKSDELEKSALTEKSVNDDKK